MRAFYPATDLAQAAASALAAALDRVYQERLADAVFSVDQQALALEWCLAIARKRVQAIVGGLHRKSYDKAAVLTAACSEMLRARGDRAGANNFVAEIKAEFPRHSAFQKELRSALSVS